MSPIEREIIRKALTTGRDLNFPDASDQYARGQAELICELFALNSNEHRECVAKILTGDIGVHHGIMSLEFITASEGLRGDAPQAV